MNIKRVLIAAFVISFSPLAFASGEYVYKAGHASLQEWLLPDEPPYPKDNEPNEARIKLGKTLFFDPRLSGDGNMSCATCHSPLFGWSDGLPTARGSKSQILDRASPVVTNTAFNALQMWDGRKKSLEDQAMGPMEAAAEMNMDIPKLFKWLNGNSEYVGMFKKAYPGEPIDDKTLAKAIASFERTIVSNNSRFDQWVKGDKKALSKDEIKGFKVFVDPEKGNCAVCHGGGNFTDDGFHNIGLASFGKENPDLGRYAQRPLGLMKGAFKTPTLRDVELSAPYFHDGSANTLMEVIDHYVKGGVVKTNLSPNMKALKLSKKEKRNLEKFLLTLTTPVKPFELPILPIN